MLVDTAVPRLLEFFPPQGNQDDVALDTSVTITFDEDVRPALGSQYPTMQFWDLSEDSMEPGTLISLDFNSNAVTWADNELIVHLDGLAQAGKEYSLALEPGVISDLVGNMFPGLPRGQYSFRTVPAIAT